MKIGDLVEDFTLPDETGEPRTLSSFLADGPVVLFFYPAALTPGCTAEACHFRDIVADFKAVGAQLIGISGDPVDKQAEFSAKHSLGYPLLSDPAGTVRSRFGVKRSVALLPTKRVTFVITPDHRIKEIIKSEVRMSLHADKALAVLTPA
ncbi:peroxiredoxin [Actinocorallia lasiicapitis]